MKSHYIYSEYLAALSEPKLKNKTKQTTKKTNLYIIFKERYEIEEKYCMS